MANTAAVRKVTGFTLALSAMPFSWKFVLWFIRNKSGEEELDGGGKHLCLGRGGHTNSMINYPYWK